MKLLVLIAALYLAGFGCKAKLTGTVSDDGSEAAAEEESITEEGGVDSLEEAGKKLAAKLTASDCKDPDLSLLAKGQTFMLCDGSVGEGTLELPDLTHLTADKIVAGTTIGGVKGTYTPPAPPAPDFPDAANVLATDTVDGIAGTYTPPTPDFPDAANVLADDTVDDNPGTMANHGTWDMTAAFSGLGYYDSLTNAPAANEYLSTTTINNQAGSIIDRGGWDMTLIFPGDGLYTTPTNVPPASEVCDTTTFNGAAGDANCGGLQGNMGGGMLRTKGSGSTATQLTLTTHLSTSGVPAGHRTVPRIGSDDGNPNVGDDYGLPVTAGDVKKVNATIVRRSADLLTWQDGDTNPTRKVCGKAATSIADKIDNCDTVHNGDRPAWDDDDLDGRLRWNGAVHGTASEGSWTLIAIYDDDGLQDDGDACPGDGSCREVWRDDRTGLIWSDRIEDGGTITFNWCHASGSNNNDVPGNPYAEDDTSNYCDNVTYQRTTYSGGDPQGTLPISLCFEDSSFLVTPSFSDNDKGDLNVGSTPSVFWYLPTIQEQASAFMVNGGYYVLPNSYPDFPGHVFWSSSVIATHRSSAWQFIGTFGYIYYDVRSFTYGVRCVGRP